MKMENEIQVEAFPSKVLSVMRALFFMLKKGISKKKVLLHLNLKRSKIAFHHHHHHHHSTTNATADLLEFSCSNTPAHHKFFSKRKHYKAQYSRPIIEEDFMINLNDVVEASSSPVLPGLLGFRPIRVTDSPYPVLSGQVDDGDCHVDEAAEEFITRVYSQFRMQAITDG